MSRIKIVITVLIILFVGSFFVQTKYFNRIVDENNIGITKYDNETTWMKVYEFKGLQIRLVDILLLVTIGLISSMIILLIFILFNRNRMEKRSKLRNYLLEKYQELIIKYLYEEDVTKKDFRKIARNRFSRQILIEQIIDVSLNLYGKDVTKLRELYFEIGLIKDTVRKVKSRKWHKKIKGFKELASLNIKNYNHIIEKCINKKNDVLRIESHIALVKLSDDEEPFSFLGELDYHFSLWEQITLYQLMVENEMNVPNFGKWTNSKNVDVVMFCLRMIREYEQVNNFDELDEALLHENEKVRKTAIEVIGDLRLFSLFKVLKKKYKHETYENSLEIVKTMGKQPVKSVMRFLQNVVDVSDDVNLQIEAVNAINNMGEDGKVRLDKMMKSDYKNYGVIIKHVLDKRIN